MHRLLSNWLLSPPVTISSTALKTAKSETGCYESDFTRLYCWWHNSEVRLEQVSKICLKLILEFNTLKKGRGLGVET